MIPRAYLGDKFNVGTSITDNVYSSAQVWRAPYTEFQFKQSIMFLAPDVSTGLCYD